MSFHLDYLLNLPGITVETCSYIENYFCLQLGVISEGMSYPHCQHYTEELHQDRPILVRDLPTFGKAVIPTSAGGDNNCTAQPVNGTRPRGWNSSMGNDIIQQRYEEGIRERVQTGASQFCIETKDRLN